MVALIDGMPIDKSMLIDDLIERAGRHALYDLILEHQLNQEMIRLNIGITKADLKYEETQLMLSNGENESTTLDYTMLNDIKDAKGLGPIRYHRLLNTNAMLRRAIADAAQVNEYEYTIAKQIAYGPGYRVRLFVCDQLREATALRRQLQDEAPALLPEAFSQACSTRSIHPSSSRGGLISRISISDPAYPSVLSEAIASTPIGELSSVLALDAGYAIVIVESHTPASIPTAIQVQSLRQQLTDRKQRLHMRVQADELVSQTDLIILDRALSRAWKTNN